MGLTSSLPTEDILSHGHSQHIQEQVSTPLVFLEKLGFVGWCFFWSLESLADAQKVIFMTEVMKQRAAAGTKQPPAVLGHAPFDTPRYGLWTLCRHPNYFCEWMCWNSLVCASIPSLLVLSNCSMAAKFALAAILFFVSRFFHDCLLHWTGAAPAEFFSVQKRGAAYKEYQATTRCFWPFEMPGVDHFRESGWPHAAAISGEKSK